MCYEDGSPAAEFLFKPEDHYSRGTRFNYEALDLIIESLTDPFDQPRYRLYLKLRTVTFESS